MRKNKSEIYRQLEKRVQQFYSTAPDLNDLKDLQRVRRFLKSDLMLVDKKIAIEQCLESNSFYRTEVPANFRELLAHIEKRFKKLAKHDPVIVNPDMDELFIALIEKKKHTSIVLGVIKKDKPIVLARVGKTNYTDPDIIAFKNNPFNFWVGIKWLWRALFFTTEAQMIHEGLTLNGKIQYSAHSINLHQYQQFLYLLSRMQVVNCIDCYQPVDKKCIIEFDYKPLNKPHSYPSQIESDYIQKTTSLSLGNTCRHTGIDLIEYTQDGRAFNKNISRQFFQALPHKALFRNGKSNDYLFVFPQPPESFGDTDQMILKKIYQRMENLLIKDPQSRKTIKKFKALKELYLKQAAIAKNDVQGAYESIRLWKHHYEYTINRLRKPSFFGKFFQSESSTERMAKKIEEQLIFELSQLNFRSG